MAEQELSIQVPPVPPKEVGPRDAESRAVGGHPGFQRLLKESRECTAAGDPGTSVDDLLRAVEGEDAEGAGREPAHATRSAASRQ